MAVQGGPSQPVHITGSDVSVNGGTVNQGSAGSEAWLTTNAAIGATTDAEATGNGTLIAIVKRLRTLLGGGLPAALASGALKTALYGKNAAEGDTALLLSPAGRLQIASSGTVSGDANGNPATIPEATGDTGRALSVASQLYNGSSWDRERNNLEGTALASATRTATTNSADIVNYNARGVAIFLNVTAASGTGGLTPRIQWKDPISGNYSNLNAAPTAITAGGTSILVLCPGAQTASVNIYQSTGLPLPRTWRVSITHGDASSYTYSVAYSFIN